MESKEIWGQREDPFIRIKHSFTTLSLAQSSFLCVRNGGDHLHPTPVCHTLKCTELQISTNAKYQP